MLLQLMDLNAKNKMFGFSFLIVIISTINEFDYFLRFLIVLIFNDWVCF